MGRWFVTLIILLWASVASAQDYAWMSVNLMGGAGTSSAFSCAYDLCETFNGASECASGYSSTCDNAWTVTKDAADTIDFDNTTAPAPLDGTYGLRMTSANTTGSNIKIGFVDADNAYAFFMVNLDAKGTETQYRCIAGFITDAGADVCWLCLNNANPGRWVVYNGTGFTPSPASTPSADTTYYVWLEHVKNTSCTAYISTNTTKPSATATIAGKNSQAGSWEFQTKHSTDLVFGKFRQDGSAIGDNPQ